MTAVPNNEIPREQAPEAGHWSSEILKTAKDSLAAAKDSFPGFRAEVNKLPHNNDQADEQRHLVVNATLGKLDKLLISITA